MGFRCPKCKQDFGTDKAAFERHLRDEEVVADMPALATTNLADIVKGVSGAITLKHEYREDKSKKSVNRA